MIALILEALVISKVLFRKLVNGFEVQLPLRVFLASGQR